MKIKTMTFSVKTKGRNDIIDITSKVDMLLREANMKEGSVLVFAPGATTGITTIEYELGLLQDYPEFFEKIIPSNQKYHHDETWNDHNGYSHVRSALQGASFTVPFKDGKLILGTWQQIVLIDFDNRERSRNIIAQFTGQ
ncbi:MAG: secondary thiamine-phosphate synthase enzyme YjbQ [Melioribacteraceae bacterium]|nr:secondary thiamine-phosphate synthase enzyme YjbQ [Melioribacteraceae bacterium]MCF8354036.1 secondary thiamine-phosphate synthase enzyme YjbQ [Melioribacteraceae bacterium]MCF8392283.1 secondary thiamine-phosphate synthase enzyme YjbQ [Melioribacteraceae bacterium]MCF8417615.1 secondary thiamine-phosphate synthase enzyme YjbQ [Melioribacteraceae bacterium]